MLDLRPLGPPAATTAPPHSNRPSRRVVESDDSADDIDDSPHAAVEVERSPRSYGQRQQQDQDPPPVSCGTDGEEGSLKIAGPARGPAVIPVLVRQRRAEALPNRASMQADDLVDDDELPDFDFVQELGTGILQAPEQPQQQPTRVNHITARAKNTFVRQVASATGVAAEAAASDISDEGVSIGGNGRGDADTGSSSSSSSDSGRSFSVQGRKGALGKRAKKASAASATLARSRKPGGRDPAGGSRRWMVAPELTSVRLESMTPQALIEQAGLEAGKRLRWADSLGMCNDMSRTCVSSIQTATAVQEYRGTTVTCISGQKTVIDTLLMHLVLLGQVRGGFTGTSNVEKLCTGALSF